MFLIFFFFLKPYSCHRRLFSGKLVYPFDIRVYNVYIHREFHRRWWYIINGNCRYTHHCYNKKIILYTNYQLYKYQNHSNSCWTIEGPNTYPFQENSVQNIRLRTIVSDTVCIRCQTIHCSTSRQPSTIEEMQ